MTTFHLGSAGPEVTQLQQSLNATGPTRLPQLPVDGNFGALTLARVLEFQENAGLSVDGAVGPITLGKLAASAGAGNDPAPRGRSILADLVDRQLTAYQDGAAAFHTSPIAGGRPGFPSTQGVFRMSSRRLRRHSSSEFPSPSGKDNMDFAMFYHGGEAIHEGNPNTPSHGCIHVGAPDAERLFAWVGDTDVVVIVAKG